MDTLYTLVETDITGFITGDLMLVITTCLGIALLIGAIGIIKNILFKSSSVSFGIDDNQGSRK